jgi:hypothetical protein
MDAALRLGQSVICCRGVGVHVRNGNVRRLTRNSVPPASILQRLQLSRHLLRSMLGGIGTKISNGPLCTKKRAPKHSRDRQHGRE